jgi:hypothetical protein
VVEIGRGLDQLPEPDTAVSHQEPAALGLDGDELGDEPG